MPRILGLADDVLLDGFVIQGGRDYGTCRGAGLINDGVSVTVQNCVFVNNQAGYYGDCESGGEGGAMFNRDASVTITNTLFLNNAAAAPPEPGDTPHGGGAMFNMGSSVLITDSAFILNYNMATTTPWSGGGALCRSRRDLQGRPPRRRSRGRRSGHRCL